MDPFTHLLLGSCTAQAAARVGENRRAALTGGLAAVLPDLDVFLPSGDDTLSAVLMHRHFTHSIVFMPVGALFAALLVWLLLRRSTPFLRILTWALLGIATHATLDSLTAYGTLLLWPFSDERVGLGILPVIEVVFTTGLVIAVATALLRDRPGAARIGLAFVCAWILLAGVQHHRVTNALEAVAAERGSVIERTLIHPTLGNIALWHTLYEADGHYYFDAIYVGPLGRTHVYAGDRAPAFYAGTLEEVPVDSRLARDVERFTWFADSWLITHPDHPNFIGDARYGGLPREAPPLWGIRYDPDDPDVPAGFKRRRAPYEQDWGLFLRMVAGQAVGDVAGTRWDDE